MASGAKLLLFQYGSNMSVARMRRKIQQHRQFAPAGTDLSVRQFGYARLPRFRLVFDLYSAVQDCLVSDIIEGGESDEVWGAVYELDGELVQRSDGGRSVLDGIEGHKTTVNPENYRPVRVTVLLDEVPVQAVTYVGIAEARHRCAAEHPDARAAPAYLDALLTGAAEVGLSARYLIVLEEAAAAVRHDR